MSVLFDFETYDFSILRRCSWPSNAVKDVLEALTTRFFDARCYTFAIRYTDPPTNDLSRNWSV